MSETPSLRLLDTSWSRRLRRNFNSSYMPRSTRMINWLNNLVSQRELPKKERHWMQLWRLWRKPLKCYRETQISPTPLLERMSWRTSLEWNQWISGRKKKSREDLLWLKTVVTTTTQWDPSKMKTMQWEEAWINNHSSSSNRCSNNSKDRFHLAETKACKIILTCRDKETLARIWINHSVVPGECSLKIKEQQLEISLETLIQTMLQIH
jgi:hypothetical protein